MNEEMENWLEEKEAKRGTGQKERMEPGSIQVIQVMIHESH